MIGLGLDVLVKQVEFVDFGLTNKWASIGLTRIGKEKLGLGNF